MNRFKDINGQTLIEALIALGVSGVIIGAIAMTVISSMDNANFSKHQNLSSQYAQQGLDLVRQLSESDWNNFSTKSGTYCLDIGSTNLVGPVADCPNPSTLDGYKRKVIISNTVASCLPNGTNVKLIVSWTDGNCPSSNIYCHNTNLESCFAQVNNVPSL